MSAVALHQVGLEEVKRHRGWYLALGMLLVFLGTVAIRRTYLLTAVSVLFFAYLMIAAGAAQAIHAFWKERGWAGFFVDLLMGLLYVVAGFMIVANPAAGALTLTLLIAMFLILDGIGRASGGAFSSQGKGTFGTHTEGSQEGQGRSAFR